MAITRFLPLVRQLLPLSESGLFAQRKDMATSFSQAEVFPLIARVILQASTGSTGFVEHAEIVSRLLADADGASIVDRAANTSMLPNSRRVATNMVSWFSQQISINNSPWVTFFEREQRNDRWAYRPVTASNPSLLSESDLAAIEGNPQMYFHLRRERDARIAQAKRDSFVAVHGTLYCECCQFKTHSVYEDLGSDVCEIHHRSPLALASEPVTTTLNDLAVLCPNCHRAIHKTNPLLSVEEFSLKYFGHTVSKQREQ